MLQPDEHDVLIVRGDASRRARNSSFWDRHPNAFCVTSSLVGCVVFIILLGVLAPEIAGTVNSWVSVGHNVGPEIGHSVPSACDKCQLRLVESIPEGLVYNSSVEHMRTHEAWTRLLDLAEKRLELASSYWSLRGKDVYVDPSDWQGEDIYARLVNASKSGITIKIAQNLPSPGQPNLDTEDLSKLAGISVRSLNFTALMGAGILHSKLWVVDRRHFYVGSANFDWRSLTQVKELGVLVTDCPCLAADMAKIFEVYWTLGGQGKSVPDRWPKYLSTQFNHKNPMTLANNADQAASQMSVYLSSSPPPFCPAGRELDHEAIVAAMDEAKEFIDVAVMDYAPETVFDRKHKTFWPVLEDAMRRAAVERGVRVRLLFSEWAHTKPDMLRYLRSLRELNGTGHGRVRIEGKLFKVPAFTPAQAAIPYARVNHNKYMVTESRGYVGTSNWEADYFIDTGGIGFAFEPESNYSDDANDMRRQLADLFDRDWNSAYARADF